MPVGSRIRDNDVYGSITDNPLTAAATSFNSNQLVLLSAVIGNHAVITLDPIRQFGDPEIIIVTAHTAAATVATITRGAYGTTPRIHPQGTVWVHAAVTEDFTSILTSATRPSDPYNGERIFETDTNRLVARSTASAWQQEGLFFDPPACRVFHSTTQSFAVRTYQALVFDSERYDTDSMHSTSVNTGRITFNTAGLYVVTLNVGYTNAADYLSARASIRLNGLATEIAEAWGGTQTDANDHYYVTVSTVYKFAAADYIEAMGWQNNSANAARNIVSVGNKTPEFTATWIGRGN